MFNLTKTNNKYIFILALLLTSCSLANKKNELAINNEFAEPKIAEVKPYPLTQVKNPEDFIKYYLRSKISIYNAESIDSIANNLYKLALENPTDDKIQEKAFIVLLAAQEYAKALTVSNNNPKKEKLTFEELLSFSQELAQGNTQQAEKLINKTISEQSNLPFLKIIQAYFKYEQDKNLENLAVNIINIKSSMELEGFKYYYLARAYEDKQDFNTAFKLYFASFKKFGLRTEDVFMRMAYVYSKLENNDLKNNIELESKYGKNIYLIDQAFIDISKVKVLDNSLKGVSSQVFYDLGWSINQTTGGFAGLNFLALANYISPNDKTSYQIAKGYRSNNWHISAQDLLEAISEDSIYYISAQLILADIIKENNYDLAIAKIKTLQKNGNINSNYVESVLGQLYLNKEDFKQAITSYTKALKFDDSAKNHFSRAIAYERDGQIEKAIADLKISLDKNPLNPVVLNYIGYIMVDIKHNIPEGIEYIEKAVKLDPTNSSSLDSLGWAHIKNKDYKKGLEILEAAYILKPFDGIITGHLGDAYLHNNRKNEAIIYWNKALDLEKDDTREIERIKNQLYKYNN